MGFKKISELDPAALVNDSDLFAGAQEENNTLDNKKYTAEQLKLYFQDGTQPELTFDDAPVENSNNPVKSGGLYSEFATKQDVLTFDAMPIDGSSNPVTSDGIEEAIASSEARSIPLSQKGEAGGVAELDSSGKVLSSQLPSYVDDVEEYLTRSNFPVFGEGGKIYIALDTNLAYRWTGSGYAEISPSLALGETSSTAYRGDRGKTAYDFSQSPYASAPAMDGTASAGSSNSWSRGDHVHPKDASKQDVLTFDNTPTENSTNPVKSGGVYSSLATKQDALTFDNAPTENSTNPVKSSGIYDAILRLHPKDTASGAPANFPDGADGMPVVDLKVAIGPVQSGSGDPSPSNVRPISGRTGLTLYHSGADPSDYDELAVSWQSQAGTIYGGTLDVISGILTADRVMVTLDGSISWSAYNSAGGTQQGFLVSAENAGVANAMAGSTSVTAPYITCSLLPAGTVAWTVNTCGMQNRNFWFGFRSSDFNGVNAFKAYANDHPIQMVIPIDNPSTYQLTPAQVRTLLGENNIWVDFGIVTVEYRADIKLYIDKKLS